jgi:ribosomal protein S18 acetylase RimI-like enzyme
MKDGLEPLDPRDSSAVDAIARLHSELLPGSPISRLGRRFMRRFYYRLLVADRLIGGHLFYVEGQPAGFIAYTAQPGRFMIEGLKRHWLFLSGLMGADLLADPRRLRTVIWTLNHMRQPGHAPAPGEGEILSFGVSPEFRNSQFVRRTGRRVSAELFECARDYFRRQGIAHYRAVVESGNREALLFYHAHGCRPKAGERLPGRVVIGCQDVPGGGDGDE